MEKVTAARYKIQPVYLTKKKHENSRGKGYFLVQFYSSKQLLTDTSVFWIQYLTEKNGLYFSFHIKIRVLMVV